MPYEFDFDVAVSFAGEDRALVAEVVEGLKTRGVSVFYDQDFTAEMWGENLVDYLQTVYRLRARFVIMFVSRHYRDKMWTRHERESAQSRAIQQDSAYILPVRLDDTELPGLHVTTGYLDARDVGAGGIVDTTLDRLGVARVAAAPRFNGRVPRTEAEFAVVLRERPTAWEYLLWFGLLKQGLDALEDKYRDHQIGYAVRNGRFVRPADAVELIERNLGVLLSLVDGFDRILSAQAQDAAFGREGGAGDPDRIRHLARRLVGLYEEFLDHAADLRATSAVSSAFREMLDLQARMANEPIERIRGLVTELVREGDTLVERAEAGTDVVLAVPLVLDFDHALMARFSDAVTEFVLEQRAEAEA
ncbi:TIR domain-containing protein [Actinophytocola sp. NPDC049390]|uniref:TIR domain-containing protein n=1 Tax=Actinophytocola sp. NPDC049390 TaxID=3363894 RepID=UPI0037B069DC